MAQIEEEIGEEMRRISKGKGMRLRFPVMTGTAVAGSVDESANTCDVLLTTDSADSPTKGVLLSVKMDNANGIILYPADGADVIVAEIDDGTDHHLLWASKYDKVMISADTLIQLNDGSLGGLPIVGKVKDNDKAIRDYIKNTLEPKIHDAINAVGVGSAANGPAAATSFTTSLAGSDISFEDMENTKIKQG